MILTRRIEIMSSIPKLPQDAYFCENLLDSRQGTYFKFINKAI